AAPHGRPACATPRRVRAFARGRPRSGAGSACYPRARMEIAAPGTIARFADVRARLLSGYVPGDITLGPDTGAMRFVVGRAVVAVAEAGAHLPDGADVIVLVGAEPAILGALSSASARRVQVLALPCTPQMFDAAMSAA